jgi:UDP-glucose 4-epimerase
MNILVTGGAGFIGYHLLKLLQEKYPKSTILVIDNYSSGSELNHHPFIKYLSGNTIDIFNIMTDQPIPNIVFHLGEFSRIRPSYSMIDDVWKSNCAGTYEVIKFCHQHQAKLIYTGSSSKFGKENNQHLSPYAWFKAKNIELMKNYNHWFGLDYRIGYLCNVFGSRQICSGPYATVIGIFEKQYRENIPRTIIAPGTQRRCFTYVGDICQGLIQIMDYSSCCEFILGNQQSHSIVEVAQMFGGEYQIIPEQKGERFDELSFNEPDFLLPGWSAKMQLSQYIKDYKMQIKK